MGKLSTQINLEKFELANKWLHLRNNNISILQNLKERGITKIVIYGASEFAVRLLEQCENENGIVEVVGIGDKKISSKGAYYKNIPLLSINDIVEMDINGLYVIITAMGFYTEILRELHEKGITNIISLRELIYDSYSKEFQKID